MCRSLSSTVGGRDAPIVIVTKRVHVTFKRLLNVHNSVPSHAIWPPISTSTLMPSLWPVTLCHFSRSYSRAGTGSRVTGSPGHRVSDYVRVGSGLGSKLFSYRPGIVTRLLTEQQNDTAWLTHKCIVQSRGSINTRPLNLKHSKLTLIASQLAPCVAAVYDAANPSRLPHRLMYLSFPSCRLLRPQVLQLIVTWDIFQDSIGKIDRK